MNKVFMVIIPLCEVILGNYHLVIRGKAKTIFKILILNVFNLILDLREKKQTYQNNLK